LIQEKDVCLLDDPLSAVDAHVARHIFDNCIMGILRSKTRILATHHTHFLRHADLVVVMANGRIVQCGEYLFHRLSQISILLFYAGPPGEITALDLTADHELKHRKRASSESYDDDELLDVEEEEQNTDVGLMEEEERAEGAVQLSVYGAYWKAVGRCLSPLIILALLLMQGKRSFLKY
jgi:ATP-binding cassette subfamily C (CFTR/MRP) protein 10